MTGWEISDVFRILGHIHFISCLAEMGIIVGAPRWSAHHPPLTWQRNRWTLLESYAFIWPCVDIDPSSWYGGRYLFAETVGFAIPRGTISGPLGESGVDFGIAAIIAHFPNWGLSVGRSVKSLRSSCFLLLYLMMSGKVIARRPFFVFFYSVDVAYLIWLLIPIRLNWGIWFPRLRRL